MPHQNRCCQNRPQVMCTTEVDMFKLECMLYAVGNVSAEIDSTAALSVILSCKSIVKCHLSHTQFPLKTHFQCITSTELLRQEGQHPLTGQRAANFRRDLEAT